MMNAQLAEDNPPVLEQAVQDENDDVNIRPAKHVTTKDQQKMKTPNDDPAQDTQSPPPAPAQPHTEELNTGFDLTEESYDADYVEVADGVWSVCTTHLPGLIKGFPSINNRAFVFRLRDEEEGEFLLVFGIPNELAIAKIQKLEQAVGIKVKIVLSTGDMHHLFLIRWLELMPNARYIMPKTRFPETRNGKELLASHGDKIELFDETSVPMLTKYQDQVQFICFNQVTIYSDKSYMSKSCDEPSKLSAVGYITHLMSTKMDARAMYIWCYHPPTKTLLSEHNFTMYFTKEEHKRTKFPVSMLLPSETFNSNLPGFGMRVTDPKLHAETWKRVMDLDVRMICDAHTKPTVAIRRYSNAEEMRTELGAKIHKTGEDDPTGERLFYKHKKCTIM